MVKDNTPRYTEAQWDFKNNSAAAYALETGKLVEGMGYIYNKTRVINEPLVQRALFGTQLLMDAQNKYIEEMQKWEASEDKTEETKPHLDLGPQMEYAQKGFEDIKYSAQMRTGTFQKAYEEMTIDQLGQVTLYGSTKKNLPSPIKTLLGQNKNTIVGSLEDGALKEAAKAFKRYHVLGSTASEIKKFEMMSQLEGIANEYSLPEAA